MEDALLPFDYIQAIQAPDGGRDEELYNDGRLRVSRRNNKIWVEGIGKFQPPFWYR